MIKEISKVELKKIYIQNTNDKACKILGVSKVTLIKMVSEAGIELKGKHSGRKYRIV